MELEKFTGSPAHQGGVGSGATFWRLQHFGDVSMPVRGEKLLDGWNSNPCVGDQWLHHIQVVWYHLDEFSERFEFFSFKDAIFVEISAVLPLSW